MMTDERWKEIYRLSDYLIKHINSQRKTIGPSDSILALAIVMAEVVRASSADWELVDKAIDWVKHKSAEKLNSLT